MSYTNVQHNSSALQNAIKNATVLPLLCCPACNDICRTTDVLITFDDGMFTCPVCGKLSEVDGWCAHTIDFQCAHPAEWALRTHVASKQEEAALAVDLDRVATANMGAVIVDKKQPMWGGAATVLKQNADEISEEHALAYEYLDSLNETQELVLNECLDIGMLLIEKNRKYGNSALDPLRLFSKADPIEAIKVRIDDKLSRLRNAADDEDEDVVKDLMGYLVLLRVAQKQRKTQEA